jgi:hypothetical protein
MSNTDKPGENPEPAHLVTLVESLMKAAVEQEASMMTVLQTGLKMAAHGGDKPRADAEIEADLDNLPI